MTMPERITAFNNAAPVASATELERFQELWLGEPGRTPYRVELVERKRGARSVVLVKDVEPDAPFFMGIGTPSGFVAKRIARPRGLKAGINTQRGHQFNAHIKHLRK